MKEAGIQSADIFFLNKKMYQTVFLEQSNY